MAGVTKEQLQFLKPFLEGSANDVGEIGMHCPFHDDETRSASLNVEKGVWFCTVCVEGGGVKNLIHRIQMDAESHGDGESVAHFVDEQDEDGKEGSGSGSFRITESQVEDWHEQLVSSPRVLAEFQRLRGLSTETIRRFSIGWDQRKKSFTIPVRDAQGELRNVRWYNPKPLGDRRKIWGVPGHNSPRLYPIDVLDSTSEVVITEGEWDALITIQNGFPAITRTAAAGVWKSSWNHLFDDKVVYICQDMDVAGADGAANIAKELRGHARKIYIVNLPYDLEPKHGKDLSDYFHKDGFTADDFEELLDEVSSSVVKEEVVKKDFVDVAVIDSYDASKAGDKLRMRVTITGKKSPTYLIPMNARYECSMDAGAKCVICPMNDLGGSAVRHVDSHDPVILELMGSTAAQVTTILRTQMGAQKCEQLTIETQDFRAVEELFVRPSVDVYQDNPSSGDYTSRKVISVGRHDSLPNNTVEIVGSIYPNPRGQHNEFQAWDVTKTETSIDNFDLTTKEAAALRVFQSKDPLEKIFEIADDLSANVTKIYGRREMHVLMDLVYHSAMSFSFSGSMQTRGWLEALFVGDTRTGKSEVAERLIRHYQAGEMVSCESATFAGIVGGLQQMGSGKEWEITWGAIPINDRRLVVLDEISGLTQEQIAQMSSIRSSGEAQLTKIRSERTWARTRLIWMGNPRNGRMSDYTYGVNAIKPLIGNNEDIARFDLAMSVKADEVDTEEINRFHAETTEHIYTSDISSLLLRWVWSREPHQVVISPDAEELIFKEAIELGRRYIESPPLVQAANVRIKLARLSVAIAARTFSTDKTHELIMVNKRHVQDAVKFMDHLYNMQGFGYGEISKEAIADIAEAARMSDDAKRYLVGNVGLAKFLRATHGSFRRTDLEDMLNMSREEANAMINSLWKFRLITRQGPNIRINPILHDILRDVRE